jgi:hypothetical protein
MMFGRGNTLKLEHSPGFQCTAVTTVFVMNPFNLLQQVMVSLHLRAGSSL